MKAHRSIIIAMIVASIGIVTLETVTVASGQLSPFDRIVGAIFSPFQRILVAIGDRVENQLMAGTFRTERDDFEQQVFLLNQQVAKLQAADEENKRLREILTLKSSTPIPTVAAEVVGRDPSLWFQELTLNRGSSDGIALNAGVTGVGGVVGKILSISPHVSKVRLLLDASFSVPVEVVPGGAQGIAGAGDEGCVIKYLPHDSFVKPGDKVITSGYGHVFGKGILVGTVRRVEPGEKTLFKSAFVKPGIDASRIESVLVFVP